MPTRDVLATSRAISAVEFLIGAAVVLGHNVFHVVPNEVIILFVLGLVSVRVRNGSFAALGFRRPDSWTRIILIALAAAAVRLLIGDGVLVPLAERIWPPAEVSTVVENLEGNLQEAALMLLLVWSFAAFGEEIAYRGYLLNRGAEALAKPSTGGNGENGQMSLRGPEGRSNLSPELITSENSTREQPTTSQMPTWAYIIAAVLTSILFGYGHYYKGPVGILDSTFAGLVLAAAYLATGRNLWTCILAHGFIDTIAVALTYLGWAD